MNLWTCPFCGLRTRGYGVQSHRKHCRHPDAIAFRDHEKERSRLARLRLDALVDAANALKVAHREAALQAAPEKALARAAQLPPGLRVSRIRYCLSKHLNVGVLTRNGLVFFGAFNKRGQPVLFNPCGLKFLDI